MHHAQDEPGDDVLVDVELVQCLSLRGRVEGGVGEEIGRHGQINTWRDTFLQETF